MFKKLKKQLWSYFFAVEPRQFFETCPTVCFFKKDGTKNYVLQHSPRKRTILYKYECSVMEFPYTVYVIKVYRNSIINFKIFFSDKPIRRIKDLKNLYSLDICHISDFKEDYGSVCLGSFELQSNEFNKKNINQLIANFWHTRFIQLRKKRYNSQHIWNIFSDARIHFRTEMR